MNKNIKIISAIISSSLATIHLLNRMIYAAATKNDILSNIEDQYYEWRFGKIHYVKKGSGKPLLLVHDLTIGSSSYEFHKIINQLSKQYEIYAIDLLGYGLSDKPNMTYTSFLYVQLLTDFIKTVIGKKTDIIATGDTSSIAIVTCHNNPEVFNKLVFINPQSLYQLNLIPTKRTKTLKILIDLPVIGTFIFNIITSKYSFLQTFRKYYFSKSSLLKKRDLLAYREASHIYDYNSKYSFSSHIGRYMNFNILHALKEINHSMFIITGNDKSDNKSITENYIYYNSSIETANILKTRQYPHLEKPEKLLDQLEIFL